MCETEILLPEPVSGKDDPGLHAARMRVSPGAPTAGDLLLPLSCDGLICLVASKVVSTGAFRESSSRPWVDSCKEQGR